jgi:hypothetical protein
VWLRSLDRLVLVWLYRSFPSILNAIAVVKPETVIRRYRRENPLWGAPRIHGELLMLATEVAQSTVAKDLVGGIDRPRRAGRR